MVRSSPGQSEVSLASDLYAELNACLWNTFIRLMMGVNVGGICCGRISFGSVSKKF